jgi:hypothetical protein
VRWEDERYVRLYTRDTITWKMLPWEGKALLALLFRKVDRAGLIDVGDYGAEGVAALVDLPTDVVSEGLAALIKARTVQWAEGGTVLLVPNFLTAQEAHQSDAQRKRDQRERVVAKAKLDAITPEMSHGVTKSHETGQKVTTGHTESQVVTSGHSDPIRSEPSLALIPPTGFQEKLPGKPGAATRSSVDRWRSVAETVLDALNAARKRVHPSSRGISATYDSLRHIAERLDAGKSAADCLHVVEVCEAECRADAGSFKWFDAVTPFVAKNFERKCAADPKFITPPAPTSRPFTPDPARPRPPKFQKPLFAIGDDS